MSIKSKSWIIVFSTLLSASDLCVVQSKGLISRSYDYAHDLTTRSSLSSTDTPWNTIMLFVPQQEAWIVERMGKFHKILEPGVNFLIPFVDTVKYVNSLKEIAIDIPTQSAITTDNVVLRLDGILYVKVTDPYKTSYGVENPGFAITQIAQTAMRSELGKISLDTIFRERENLNIHIVEAINKASAAWGIRCLRYEIRDIILPPKVQEAMQMQVEAERKKRAKILDSEASREADINVAEGKKRARILASEAEQQEKINYAIGEAQAMVARAEAQGKTLEKVAIGEAAAALTRAEAQSKTVEQVAIGEAAAVLTKANAHAQSLELVGKSLETESGKSAGSLSVAEQYVKAFQNMAKTSNTILIPSDTSNVAGMVTQAMSIYKQLDKPK